MSERIHFPQVRSKGYCNEMRLGTAKYSVLRVQRARGRCSIRGGAASGAVSRVRDRVEGDTQVSRDSSETVAEPTPNLLAASRMRLQEALETTQQGGFLRRLILNRPLGCGRFAWLRRWRRRFSSSDSAEVLARLITFLLPDVVGQACNEFEPDRMAIDSTAPLESSTIAGIRSVTQDPGSNQVSIKYDTVLTQEAQGSLNDQRIQQLLLFAARNNYNPG